MGVVKADFPGQGRYAVDYILDEKERIVGVGHPDWPYTIKRDGDDVSFYSDGDRFGTLPHDIFNTILICWLMIDAPHLIDSAASTKDEG